MSTESRQTEDPQLEHLVRMAMASPAPLGHCLVAALKSQQSEE